MKRIVHIIDGKGYMMSKYPVIIFTYKINLEGSLPVKVVSLDCVHDSERVVVLLRMKCQ